ncbi:MULTISPECIES: hypothetical protein [unclassified Brenneria]|uniref:hypothetical protein n=1 Tax=unclassified Brenneria TaxID=2634434 RepID=UPI0029C192D8|nr:MULTISPECIES: hypothetical protein [unclassified Brenneria]MDX5628402.1 hypothetical protein [Brenneria sp. L3-3Z]MDX5695415.1 hypothetical protein [Brenneria sp. L4-2C]
MMSSMPGHFVGYRKFAVDRDWLKRQELWRDQERRRRFEQWITVTRLKSTRLWTEWAIKQWLGQPQRQGKYNVFSVEDVKAAERKKAFKDWRLPRLEKKRSTDAFFEIPKL